MNVGVPGLAGRLRMAAACLFLSASCLLGLHAVRAALTTQQRGALVTYLNALQHGDYERAFAVLTPEDRKYFGAAANFASIFRADRFKLDAYRVLGTTKTADPQRVVAHVSERIRFFDHAHQVSGSATVRVGYAVVAGAGSPNVDDASHPWRALAPTTLSGSKNGVRILIRKVSFFTGRVEIVATFQNLGDRPVTVLPFLRTTLRDETGASHPPIATRIAGLTDATLYTGLNLAASAQYTGAINFSTAERYTPKRLSLVVAPALAEGGDAPFDVALPPIDIPDVPSRR